MTEFNAKRCKLAISCSFQLRELTTERDHSLPQRHQTGMITGEIVVERLHNQHTTQLQDKVKSYGVGDGSLK